MKKSYWSFMLLLILSMVLGSFSSVVSAEEKKSYDVFCLNQAGTQLERMSYPAKEGGTETLLPALIAWLQERHASSGNQALFPEGMELGGYEIAEGVLDLSFDSAYLEMGKTREVLVRAGLVKIFLQLEDIQAVQIHVDGKPLTDSKGAEIGAMTGDNFVELTSQDKDSYRYDTFLLYFTDKDGKMLQPESRTVYYKRSIPKARVALEQLARGPLNEGNYPTIPESTELLSVIEEDDICYADFDKAFLGKALSGVEKETAIASVVNTVIQATGVSGVEISIEGESNVNFGEEISLYNFFQWNDELIQEGH